MHTQTLLLLLLERLLLLLNIDIVMQQNYSPFLNMGLTPYNMSFAAFDPLAINVQSIIMVRNMLMRTLLTIGQLQWSNVMAAHRKKYS